ncbi:hypothetical protein MHYP_G00223340 [Metynnis hypsauchen]
MLLFGAPLSFSPVRLPELISAAPSRLQQRGGEHVRQLQPFSLEPLSALRQRRLTAEGGPPLMLKLDSRYWHSWSALMDPSVCVLELLGIFFSLTAWLCSLTTTLMSCWLTLNTDLLPTESYQLGLWETCVVQELGVLECRPYDSLLGLPPDIRLARILMLATLATSLMGFTLAIPGIYVVNSCKGTETLKAKRTLKMMGGTLCLAAGILGLVPVSYVAHLTILKFFDETVPDVVPRWEFGDALFWGWGASFLHLAAGSLLVTSCLCLQGEPCPLPTSIPLQGGHNDPELSLRRRSEYV